MKLHPNPYHVSPDRCTHKSIFIHGERAE